MGAPVRVRTVDILRLAAEAHHDPRTVRRVLEGKGSDMTRSSVVDAAKRLGLELELQSPTAGDDRAQLRIRAT